MSSEGTRYEVDLVAPVIDPMTEKVVKPGRTVVFREMTGEEFESMLAQLSKGKDGATEWEIAQQGLRRCLVADAGEQLTYKDLMGPLLSRRFGAKHLLMLRQAWADVHLPDEGDIYRVRSMRVVAG